jgi:hypothetical protein
MNDVNAKNAASIDSKTGVFTFDWKIVRNDMEINFNW